MTEPDQGPVLDCSTYTHARRHPMVLGKIGGWSPPIQLSLAQVGVLVAGYAGLLWGWQLWARGPGTLNLVILAAGPWIPAWALRAVRVEGRDAHRTGLGLLAYALAPRRGTCGGRPCAPTRRQRLEPAAVFVTRQEP